jgi:serine/threonine protein kinase
VADEASDTQPSDSPEDESQRSDAARAEAAKQEASQPSQPSASAIDVTTGVWDEVSRRLDLFLAAWDNDTPPQLGDFLPERPLGLRRIVGRELLKADMEARQQRGLAFRLEDYLDRLPELRDKESPPIDLIYEEFHLRRSGGESVELTEYKERFPQQFQALRRLLGNGDTTSVSHAGRHSLKEVVAGQSLSDLDLLVELGKGAFAKVFSAYQATMHRVVAVKISAEMGAEPKLLSNLNHEAIVRVYDQRTLPDRKLRLLLMELAPGGTLSAVVARVNAHYKNNRKPTGAVLIDAIDEAMTKAGQRSDPRAQWRRRMAHKPWPQVVAQLGAQLASGLYYVHTRGIYHRDVKPANILLSTEGRPMLADFNVGCSGAIEGAEAEAQFGGSAAYMSVEHLEAFAKLNGRTVEDLDGRADSYSLAIVLLELLHGQRPFSDDVFLPAGKASLFVDLVEQRRGMRMQPWLRISATDAMTKRLHAILKQAMAPEKENRHRDAAALAYELELCQDDEAWSLFRLHHAGWRGLVNQLPIGALLFVNLVPNGISALFNYSLNYYSFVTDKDPSFQDTFQLVQLVINSLSFSLGIIGGLGYAWPFLTAIIKVSRDQVVTDQQLALARHRGLRIGLTIALTASFLWIVAGFAFPIAMQILAPKEPMDLRGYAQFVISLTACGLFAAAFSYLSSTSLSLGAYYPRLLESAPPHADERRYIKDELPRWSTIALIMASLVPLLSLGLVVVVVMTLNPTAKRGGPEDDVVTRVFWLVMWMLAASLAGLYVAFRSNAVIRAYIAAILRTGQSENDDEEE